jgi:hypothetical protein
MGDQRPLSPGGQFVGHRVLELWVVVAIDPDGNEGVFGDSSIGGMALVASTERTRDFITKRMEHLSRLGLPGQRLILRHFRATPDA